jgi:hypothetical protein
MGLTLALRTFKAKAPPCWVGLLPFTSGQPLVIY